MVLYKNKGAIIIWEDNLKKKYGNSITEILEYKNNILSQINNIKNSEKIIEDLLNEKKLNYQRAKLLYKLY